MTFLCFVFLFFIWKSIEKYRNACRYRYRYQNVGIVITLMYSQFEIIQLHRIEIEKYFIHPPVGKFKLVE